MLFLGMNSGDMLNVTVRAPHQLIILDKPVLIIVLGYVYVFVIGCHLCNAWLYPTPLLQFSRMYI